MAAERLTVAAYLAEWLESSVKPGVRPRTYELYESVVRLHIVPRIGHQRLGRLSPAEVQQMLNALAAGGYAASTIKTVRTVLSSALKRAAKWEYVRRNVAALADVSRNTAARPEPYSLAEARQLLSGVRGHRLEELVVTAMLTGLRRGEVLGLRWQDVDVAGATISVSGSLQRVGGRLLRGEPKTEPSRRTLAVPPQVVEVLKRRLAEQKEEHLRLGRYWKDTGFVFTTALGTPLEPRNVNRDFAKLLQALGMRHQRFHDLRHCFATLQLENHTPAHVVQEQLGHSQISTTLDIYGHVVQALHRESAERFGELFAG